MIELLKNRAVIHIYGADAQKFLQGQVTNDIIKEQYSYNFILNNKGRYLFDFFIFSENKKSFYVDIHCDSLELLIKRLNIYKLHSDIEITDMSDEFFVLYSYQSLEDKKALSSFQDPRNNLLGFRSVIYKDSLDKNIKYVKDLYLDDKYKLVIIDGSSDLIYEKSIPIEYGADNFNAIDYHKGCYIGQEVISRAKYQGVIRKKIYQLSFGTEIALPAARVDVLDLNQNKIGLVCSHYKSKAIALIREKKYLELDQKEALIDNNLADILVPFWQK